MCNGDGLGLACEPDNSYLSLRRRISKIEAFFIPNVEAIEKQSRVEMNPELVVKNLNGQSPGDKVVDST